MSSFEEKIQKACEDRYIPGAALLCGDSKGNILYQKAFGYKSLKDEPLEPLSVDNCFVLASCTKLMTSIAALQCVERGQVTLDEDLSKIVPELQDLDILVDFDESGDPILKKAVNKVTLKSLITHTSGFGYQGMNLKYLKWARTKAAKSQPKPQSLVDLIKLPLLFEPGTSWEYGVGHDWAGVVVERLNNTTLQSYMQKNIWEPLGIKLMTFHPDEHPEVQQRLVGMTSRGPVKRPAWSPPYQSDEKVEWTHEVMTKYPTKNEWGGAGGVGAASEYFKILQSLLLNDGRLLSPSMVDKMFSPQIGPDSVKTYKLHIAHPDNQGTFFSIPPDTDVQWGLGSRIILSDLETGVRKGSLQWSGLPNLLWTIDRKSGLCMFFASNLIPFGDAKIHEYQQLFEKEMYSRFGKNNAAL